MGKKLSNTKESTRIDKNTTRIIPLQVENKNG